MPRPWPDSLFARAVLLLALVLFATLAVSAWSLRALSLYSGGDQIADLLAGQVVAQQALLRLATPKTPDAAAGPPVLDLRIAPAPPPQAIEARLPFLLRIEARLQQRLGPGTRMRIEQGAESRLWVATAADPRWIGVAVPPFAQQATQLTLVVAAVASTLVLLAAFLFARSLARPLESLGRQARALLAGETIDGAPTWRGPRELRLLGRALHEAAQARQQVERDRALLLAGLSHDLRTPLARLRLALELDPADAALRAGMAQDIEELDAILAQFIDFARGSGGEPDEVHDLAQLLAELVRSERLEPADWTLHGLEAPCLRPLRRLAVRRAVANLLRNALRHGRAPYLLELQARDAAVVVRVGDRGPGVGALAPDTLAQPFVRGDAARGGGAGSGLGLAIVAQVAREHRGALRLAPRDGGGLLAELELRAPD